MPRKKNSQRFGTPPIVREPVQAQVYRSLKQAILDAQVRPGEILSIRAIAQEFRTSTMPVREAAARLISERALESLPNRGLRVPRLDAKRAAEIFSLRILLETSASELAAQRITPAELAQIERTEKELEQALVRDDVKAALRLNNRFHFAIYRAAKCDTMIPLIESLWLQYAPTLMILMDTVGTLDARYKLVHQHHAAIIEAFKARSPKQARAAMLQDMNDAAGVSGFWSQLSQDP